MDGVLVILGVVLVMGFFSLHLIPERHLGVYYRGGRLLNTTSEAGYQFKIPFLTRHEEVLFAVQTDSVQNVPCGTASGVLVNFGKIEVVNRLHKELLLDTIRNYTVNYDKTWVYDKIHHEVNQFCSKHTLQEVYITLFNTLDDHLALQLQTDIHHWAPGIEIISVRVTKPTVPENILKKFEQVEAEVTNLQITTNQQLVDKKKAETARFQATIKAQEDADVAEIKNLQQVNAKKAQSEMQFIENAVHLEREKALADAELYKAQKKAEANELLLTENYLKLQQIISQSSISKIYFGEKIPSVIMGVEDSTTRVISQNLASSQDHNNDKRTSSSSSSSSAGLRQSSLDGGSSTKQSCSTMGSDSTCGNL